MTILWWVFLVAVLLCIQLCIGYKKMNTFTLFLPLLVLTNGIFVPFSSTLNEQIIQFKITTFNKYWLSLLLMYLALPVGILLANLLKRKKRAYLSNGEAFKKLGSLFKTKLYMYFVFMISLLSLIQIYYDGLGFDFYSYFTGKMDYNAYAEHRYRFSASTKGWMYYLYNKLPYAIAPLSIIIIQNMKGLSRLVKFTFIVVLFSSLIQTGHKMPLILILIYLVVSKFAIKEKLIISKKFILMATGLFLLSIFIIIPYFYIMQGTKTYPVALYWSVERIFLESERTLQLYFEVYPRYHEHLNGLSTQTISKIFGASNYVPPALYIPEQVLGHKNTSVPALFIGEAWADFGYAGVIISSILAGFILQFYNIWYFNKRKPLLEETALLLSIVLGSVHLLQSNILTALLQYGLITNFIIYLLIKRSGHPPIRITPSLYWSEYIRLLEPLKSMK